MREITERFTKDDGTVITLSAVFKGETATLYEHTRNRRRSVFTGSPAQVETIMKHFRADMERYGYRAERVS